MKTNNIYLFALNGVVKSVTAPNKLKAISKIVKEYPETKDKDYRKLNIIEL